MSTTIDSSWLKPSDIRDLKDQQLKEKLKTLDTKGHKNWTYQDFMSAFKLHLEIIRRIDILHPN